MEISPQYHIYDASAGSGKTFNLVRQYLMLLFSAKSPMLFRNILALTFTNKAVAEMKERIILALQKFSSEDGLMNMDSLFTSLCKDLKIEPQLLQSKSKLALRTILHNYAAFDILTIDKFNHRIIRTFANDLRLPNNFEVELDTSYLLSKAVDRLIDKAGTDKELTHLLVNFAIEKIDDGRSWDISYDLNEIAQLLTREEDREHVNLLDDKQLSDFKSLKKNLKQKIRKSEGFLVEKSQAILDELHLNGLEKEDFTRCILYNHFHKISQLNLERLYDNQLYQNILDGKVYPDRVDDYKKHRIDELLPKILAAYERLKEEVYNLMFFSNALKNLTPLSVLNAINSCLREILNEEQLVMISDFNNLIHTQIRNQDAPYIYERLGERYRHFFIDEFQDTSVLQWRNLVPLAENALSQMSNYKEAGSLLLVGDAKQAIYRWRGGKPEQFIDLYNGSDRPFSVEPNNISLEQNYRSSKAIVNFNNSFFKCVCGIALCDPRYSDLFANAHQEYRRAEEGYVEIRFIENSIEEKDLAYCENVLQIIQSQVNKGYDYKDICIITRKVKESVAIATYLNENGINIISSESLLLKNSEEVNLLVNFLKLFQNFEDNEAKIEVINFLVKGEEEKHHDFYKRFVGYNREQFFREVKWLGFELELDFLSELPLYEFVEGLIRSFNLNSTPNAYIQGLLEEVYRFSNQKNNGGLNGFLEYWKQKSDKLSVISPREGNAVELMTIHKSKGLEFPVVIFPFANQKIYSSFQSKLWFEVNPEEFEGFSSLLINLNKSLEDVKIGDKNYYREARAYEEFDSLNLLYVTLTRPKDKLFIISENDLDSKGNPKLSQFSGLFIEYLRQEEMYSKDALTYTFGVDSDINKDKESPSPQPSLSLISTDRREIDLNIVTRSGLLWDTAQKEALEKGNLIHQIFFEIDYAAQAEELLDKYTQNGMITQEQSLEIGAKVNQVLRHPLLSEYFTKEYTIYNEREIITPAGTVYRPDRVVIKDSDAIIIDYKTGGGSEIHVTQLEQYSDVMMDMGYVIRGKFLVYTSPEITVKEL